MYARGQALPPGIHFFGNIAKLGFSYSREFATDFLEFRESKQRKTATKWIMFFTEGPAGISCLQVRKTVIKFALIGMK